MTDPPGRGAWTGPEPPDPPVPPRPDLLSTHEILAAAPSGIGGWHRLHPLSPVVRTGRVLYVLVILLATAIASGDASSARFFVDVGLAAALGTAGVISWLVTRWRVEDGTLRIETGLIRRSSQRFPLVQIQAIDTIRPVMARVLGLAELRLRMAGHAGRSGRLAYLTERDADLLRARLLALAHGIAEHTPEPPQRILLSVPTGRLIGSVFLTPLGLGVIVVVATLISAAVADPATAGASIGGTAVSIIVMFTAVWRRFSGNFELTVSEAPDGLRVRAGLLTTSAETIPLGRVQAVRMIQPLLWRPLRWCRMQVDIAGRHHAEGESEAEGHQLREVLPVGIPEEARLLLDRVIPSPPPNRSRAPSRARWKTPLRYHYLSWARNKTCVVTTSGRVARVTDWVPLAKVQSLRWVQGPLQRRLRLATIHVDTAGRNIHAAIRDRDCGEADLILGELTTLCRTARRSSARALPTATFTP
jgi:putative membrane protein